MLTRNSINQLLQSYNFLGLVCVVYMLINFIPNLVQQTCNVYVCQKGIWSNTTQVTL